MPHFKPIRHRKMYLEIADQITDAIAKGVYKLGDRLPSERELAESLGVSRASVREALTALEAVGIIRIEVGQGSFVSRPSEREEFYFKQDVSPLDLMEGRVVFEESVAALVIERASEHHLAKLMDNVKQAETLIDDDGKLEEFYEVGIQFHRIFASLSGNDVLSQIGNNLVNTTDHPMWRLLNRRAISACDVRRKQVQEHQRIVNAIRLKDVDLLKASIREHLLGLQNTMID